MMSVTPRLLLDDVGRQHLGRRRTSADPVGERRLVRDRDGLVAVRARRLVLVLVAGGGGAWRSPSRRCVPLFASQVRTKSSQSIGSPSDQTALSLNVYLTVSGSSEVFSKVPNSLSGVTVPSGAKYQKPAQHLVEHDGVRRRVPVRGAAVVAARTPARTPQVNVIGAVRLARCCGSLVVVAARTGRQRQSGTSEHRERLGAHAHAAQAAVLPSSRAGRDRAGCPEVRRRLARSARTTPPPTAVADNKSFGHRTVQDRGRGVTEMQRFSDTIPGRHTRCRTPDDPPGPVVTGHDGRMRLARPAPEWEGAAPWVTGEMFS